MSHLGQGIGPLTQETYIGGELDDEDLDAETQLHEFLTKRVAHGGKFEPRAKLKAAFEEVLSVMEGCDQQEFFADKVIAVLADVVASTSFLTEKK
jgi:hypothetical protein